VARIGHVPEDRLTEGLFLTRSIRRNDAVARLGARRLGVIVISDDLPELLAACHRILVRKAGRIVHEIEGGLVSKDPLAQKPAS